MPIVLSPRDLVSRADNMDETVPHSWFIRITDVIRSPDIRTFESCSEVRIQFLYPDVLIIYQQVAQRATIAHLRTSKSSADDALGRGQFGPQMHGWQDL